jgi:hypothetical protein
MARTCPKQANLCQTSVTMEQVPPLLLGEGARG